MATAYRNSSNVIEALRAVKGLGGTVVEILKANRHIRIRVSTRMGNTIVLSLSKAKSDPYKLRGWIRQEFNRADARPATTRRSPPPMLPKE